VQERAELKAKALSFLEKTERTEAEETELTAIEARVGAARQGHRALSKLQDDERNRGRRAGVDSVRTAPS
jgi:hypothetical protein